MKVARDLDAFIADRFGRYLFGKHYLVWCSDPTLGGMVFWGTPDENDVAELVRIFDRADVRPGRDPRYDVITDGRRLDRVSSLAFEPFAGAAVRRIRQQQQQLLDRHAVIAPAGLIGAIMTGFFPLFQLGEKYRIFREAEEGYRWLGRVEVFAEVERLVDAQLGATPVVAELRGWLALHLARSTVADAARALGTSSRSLQRELGDAGTSFRTELDRARVRAAQILLAESDDKLEAVAREVGCASLSSFSRLFRRVTSEAPTEYRARSRR